MPIRNILVAFNGSDSSVSALHYAAALAKKNDAHVTALLAHSKHEVVASGGAFVPPKAREIIKAANAEIIDGIEAHFTSLKVELDLGDRLHFLREAGRVDAVLSECARSFDLLIVGQQFRQVTDEHVMIHPDRIALMSGRPVLMVPDGYDAKAVHSHAAVAWDGGRAVARALSDALQLLESQGKVSILTVGDHASGRPLSEVTDHLSRHGIDACHQALTLDHNVGTTLLTYCAEQDPCLLVMGAYEHSKFREDFLGGVTASVMRDITIPVLLSH